MAKFHSETRGLVLQDDKGVWANFENGEFETDDKDVIARLSKVDGVSKGGDSTDGEPADEGYAKQSKADLQGEIDKRNADREDADKIVPEGGNKPDLIAALEADDDK